MYFFSRRSHCFLQPLLASQTFRRKMQTNCLGRNATVTQQTLLNSTLNEPELCFGGLDWLPFGGQLDVSEEDCKQMMMNRVENKPRFALSSTTNR